MEHERSYKLWDKLEKKKNPRVPHVEIRSEQVGQKKVLREIIKSEYIKKRTNNAIQLVPALENNNSFFKHVTGMQLDYTRKHTLKAIKNIRFKQF